MSQWDLADTAGIGRSTVADFERGAREPIPENLAAIRAVLEAAGIEFIPENGGGLGVRFKRRRRKARD
jgi:transcriptional regulator with XRE-family HTH domain